MDGDSVNVRWEGSKMGRVGYRGFFSGNVKRGLSIRYPRGDLRRQLKISIGCSGRGWS